MKKDNNKRIFLKKNFIMKKDNNILYYFKRCLNL